MTKLARAVRSPEADTPSTVLLVDDSASLRQLLLTCLSRLDGIRVETATTFAEAQELLAFGGDRFTCAVLDLDLPDATDSELVDLLRAQNIPIIALTGSFDEAVRSRMHAADITDYFVKRNTTELDHVASLVGSLRQNHHIKVIVVDNAAASRDRLKGLLDNYRYKSFAAANGREALALLKRHPDVSLVITDFNLPVMNGLQLITAIRADHRREDLAIIGVADASQPELCAMMLKTGANDFIARPYQVEELYCRVTQNIGMVRYVRQIREAESHDQLTGLYNRRHIFDVGTAFHANACRGNLSMAVALVDADQLRHINEVYGHQIGDQALKAIAGVIQKTLRTGDLIGRYSGEEIICLTLIKRIPDAPIAFERLRRAVESIHLRAEGVRVPLSVSVGVTIERGESLEEMIRRADDALDQAKAEGRNRVVCL
jgi:diguanylate cyclase (GGDEF)-like protein